MIAATKCQIQAEGRRSAGEKGREEASADQSVSTYRLLAYCRKPKAADPYYCPKVCKRCKAVIVHPSVSVPIWRSRTNATAGVQLKVARFSTVSRNRATDNGAIRSVQVARSAPFKTAPPPPPPTQNPARSCSTPTRTPHPPADPWSAHRSRPCRR